MCSLFSLSQEDHVIRQDDQRAYIDILQTVTEEDSLLVAAPRRRGNTNENLPSDQKTASFSTDVRLEKMEERLTQVEGLLGKILESLKNTNSGLSPKRTQSANDLEIASSFVWLDDYGLDIICTVIIIAFT